jgi:hypothetical protein
MPRGTVR